ncbi:MAG: hypothetical protein AAF449_03615 [Myxococcota bacterium]
MSGEDERDQALLRQLRGAIEQQAEEEDRWWKAVEEGRAEALPPDAPSLEVLRPLDDDAHDALADMLLTSPPKAEAAPDDRPWPILLFRPSRVAAVGAAVLAACIIAVIFRPIAPSLPSYRMEVSGGERAFRSGTSTTSSLFTVGSVLSVVFRPAQPRSDVADFRAVLLPAEGVPRLIDAQIERASQGALRATLIFQRDWLLAAGTHRIIFVLAPENRLPNTAREVLEQSLMDARRFDYVFDYVPTL